MSDMTGTKAKTLDAFCAARGHAYLRFDYFGHGASSGAFADAAVGRWKDDALAALDALTAGPQVLVGSSLGGWLMLLAALARPDRVHALIGIAAAPDATEALMWRRFPPAVKAAILADGQTRVPSEYSPEGYLITRRLIEEGRGHLVMGEEIPLACPGAPAARHGRQGRAVADQPGVDRAAGLGGCTPDAGQGRRSPPLARQRSGASCGDAGRAPRLTAPATVTAGERRGAEKAHRKRAKIGGV